MAGLRYRCPNDCGRDPCEAARGNRTFDAAELNPSMNGTAPRCPAKTLSGAPCGETLVLLPGPAPGHWRRPVLFGGAALAVLVLSGVGLWALLSGGGVAYLVLGSETVVFTQAAHGGATGTLRIRNEGDGPLEVLGLDFSRPDFSAARPTESVLPGGAATLTIAYNPELSSPAEGTLSLRTNDPASLRTVRLVVGADPWWVYERLESTSTILSKRP
jgi:hypothetical protein